MLFVDYTILTLLSKNLTGTKAYEETSAEE